jgi:hypothetical protein
MAEQFCSELKFETEKWPMGRIDFPIGKLQPTRFTGSHELLPRMTQS